MSLVSWWSDTQNRLLRTSEGDPLPVSVVEPVRAVALNVLGHQQLTVSSTVVGLTIPTNTRPRHMMVYVGDNPVRWRGSSGTDPSTTVGPVIEVGGMMQCMDPGFDYSAFIMDVEFIRDGGADATLEIEYFS